MSVSKDEEALTQLNSLLFSLKPDLEILLTLIKDMSKIDSKYKSSFSHLRMVHKFSEEVQVSASLEDSVNRIIYELQNFGNLVEKIALDADLSELYVKEGLLDRCLALRESMLKKIASFH